MHPCMHISPEKHPPLLVAAPCRNQGQRRRSRLPLLHIPVSPHTRPHGDVSVRKDRDTRKHPIDLFILPHHQKIVPRRSIIMAGFKHAFSLSKVEVRNATPPGTVTLIGMHILQSVFPCTYPWVQSISSGLHQARYTMRFGLCPSLRQTQPIP
jgi:hypothetical protein